MHVPIGKVSFPVESLVKNYGAVLDEIVKAKPASSKGKYLRGVTTSSTMGPGVKIDPEAKAVYVTATRSRRAGARCAASGSARACG